MQPGGGERPCRPWGSALPSADLRGWPPALASSLLSSLAGALLSLWGKRHCGFSPGSPVWRAAALAPSSPPLVPTSCRKLIPDTAPGQTGLFPTFFSFLPTTVPSSPHRKLQAPPASPRPLCSSLLPALLKDSKRAAPREKAQGLRVCC